MGTARTEKTERALIGSVKIESQHSVEEPQVQSMKGPDTKLIVEEEKSSHKVPLAGIQGDVGVSMQSEQFIEEELEGGEVDDPFNDGGQSEHRAPAANADQKEEAPK